jgi:hypothetical protein
MIGAVLKIAFVFPAGKYFIGPRKSATVNALKNIRFNINL